MLSNVMEYELTETAMPRILATLFLTLLVGLPSWSQEQDAASADTSAADTPVADEAAGAPAEDDTADEAGPAVDLDADPELDQQTHARDDDEFVPSEEIPVDEAIPFPTDI